LNARNSPGPCLERQLNGSLQKTSRGNMNSYTIPSSSLNMWE